MTQNTQHINYNGANIARYHAGQMSAAEMHAIEKAALDDPFLADALEGFPLDAQFDANLQSLKELINKRVAEPEKGRRAPVINLRKWAVAAAVVTTIGIAAYFVNKKFDPKPQVPEVATTAQEKQDVDTSIFPIPPQVTVQSSLKMDTSVSLNQSFSVPQNTITKAQIDTNAMASAWQRGDEQIQANVEKVPEAPTIVAANDVKEGADDMQTSLQAQQPEGKQNQAMPANNYAKKRAEMAGPAAANYNQFNNVTNNYFAGTVTDANGKPLQGATISVYGLHKEQVTDANGRFRIVSQDSMANVVFNYNGLLSGNAVLKPGYNRSYTLTPSAGGQMTEAPDNIAKEKSSGIRRKSPATVMSYTDSRISVRVERAAPDFVQFVQINTTKAFYEDDEKVVGTLKLRFDIDKHGRPFNITVVDPLCVACQEHFIHLLKTGPNWKPIKSKRNRVDFWIE